MSVYKKDGSDTHIVYVFSCPGKKEEAAGEPAAGQTGCNLNALVKILRDLRHAEFPFRDAACINNAWSRALYGRRREPLISEVLSEPNLLRLQKELRGFEVVVCFGKRAQRVVDELIKRDLLEPSVTVLRTRHLGLSSINQIKETVSHQLVASLPKDERTDARLLVVATSLIKSL